jgi:hypothetical protein
MEAWPLPGLVPQRGGPKDGHEAFTYDLTLKMTTCHRSTWRG